MRKTQRLMWAEATGALKTLGKGAVMMMMMDAW
jgi:hypothetical protein